MNKKRYVGKAKIVGQFGALACYFNIDDLEKRDNGKCTFYVTEMKKPDELGNTHTIYQLIKDNNSSEF